MKKALCMAICIMTITGAVAAQERMTVEWVDKWSDDLDFAATEMASTHPNLYAHVDHDAFEAAIDELRQELPSLTHPQAVVELATIVAMVHDGHTRVTIPYRPGVEFFTGHSQTPTPNHPDLAFGHYPVRYYLFSDGLFVVRIGRENAKAAGLRVVRIGERAVDDAMARVEPMIQRDNDMQIKRHLPERLVVPEILHALGIVEDPNHLSIELEDDRGRRSTVTLAPVVEGETVEWVDAQKKTPLYLRDLERNFWLEYLERDRTVFMKYNEVYHESDESIAQFAERLVSLMDERGAEQLVIDVRHNPGGNNALNLALVHALICCNRISDCGDLFIITGRGTFSAAMMFCVDVEKNTQAIFVGEPTGSTPNHFGDSRKLLLPNTGLTVRVSTLYHQMSDPRDDRPYISPQVVAELTSQDYRAGRDPALEAVLAIARERGKAPSVASLAGTWDGVAIRRSIRPLETRISFTRAGDALEGTIDIPFYGIDKAPLTGIELESERVRFQLPLEDGSAAAFDAQLRGDVFLGEVTVGYRQFPFLLHRAR